MRDHPSCHRLSCFVASSSHSATILICGSRSGCGGPQMKRITTPAMPSTRPILLRHEAVKLRPLVAATTAASARPPGR
jgi:hypothetical protein